MSDTDATQVVHGGHRGVVDVLRIFHPVAVAVGVPVAPGLRNQLERTHRPIELGVAVDRAAVGVGDVLDPLAPRERNAVDGRVHRAVSRGRDPPCRPWSLSVAPIAAIVFHEMPHSGMAPAFTMAAPA